VKVQKYEPFCWWKAVKRRASAVQKIFKPIFLLKKSIKTIYWYFLKRYLG